jgi:hypothetical protein
MVLYCHVLHIFTPVRKNDKNIYTQVHGLRCIQLESIGKRKAVQLVYSRSVKYIGTATYMINFIGLVYIYNYLGLPLLLRELSRWWKCISLKKHLLGRRN